MSCVVEKNFKMAKSSNAEQEYYKFRCKLIEEIQNYSLLYDKANVKHHNRAEKDKAWELIATACEREGMYFSMIPIGIYID